jgi:hypothetical protein
MVQVGHLLGILSTASVAFVGNRSKACHSHVVDLCNDMY